MKKAYLFVIFLFFAPSTFAQTPPPGQESAAEGARFQMESEEKARQLERRKEKAPKLEVEEKKEAPAPEGPSFTLKQVKITGTSVFKQKDFSSAYEPYLNRKISFKDLEKIVEYIKAKYKTRGYLTTTAYIPEQDVTNGDVEIRMVEGKLGKVNVEGTRWFQTGLVKKYFHSKKNEILNILTAQKDMLRLNQNPDIEVKTLITAGVEPEMTDVTLTVKDHFPFHAGVGYDNQGTRLTGKDRTSFWLRSTNLTAHNDSVYANVQFSRSSSGEFVSYLLPVNTYGDKIGLNFTYFESKLGKEFKYLDMTGKTLSFTPRVTKELALSDDFQANADLGLEIKSITKKTGMQTTADDQLRTPYVSLDISKTDALFGGGQTSLSPKFSFGTAHFLGASERGHPTAARPGTGGAYFKYEHSMSRVQRMPYESYLSIRSTFAIASTELSSSEQYQLGGMNSIRGYPEGDYVADYGANLNIDWVFPMYIIPKDIKLPRSDTPLYRQIQPVIFMDLGGGGLRKPLPGEQKDKFLMGMGGGLKVNLSHWLLLRAEWAGAIGDKPASGSGPSTFHISLQSEI